MTIKRLAVYGRWHRDRNNNLVKGRSFVRYLDTAKCNNKRLDPYPKAVIRQCIYKLRRQGGTVHDIADIFKLSTRTVAKIKGKGITDLRKRSIPKGNKYNTIVKIESVYRSLKAWIHAYYIHDGLENSFVFDIESIMQGTEPP